MQALTQAVSVGWSDATHVLDDDDLTTLRQREDFQKLVKSFRTSRLSCGPRLVSAASSAGIPAASPYRRTGA